MTTFDPTGPEGPGGTSVATEPAADPSISGGGFRAPTGVARGLQAGVPPDPADNLKAVGTEPFAEDKLMIETYVSGQIHTRPEWQMFAGFIPNVVEQIHRLSLQHPEVLDLVTENLGHALAMDDASYRQALASNAPASELDSLVEAFLDETVIRGAEVAFARRLLLDEDNVRGRWEAAGIDRTELTAQAVEASGADPLSQETVAGLVGEWTHALSDRPGEWALTGRRLAGRVELETGEVNEFLIDLAPGTRIRSDADAQAAMVLAFAGIKHTVSGELAGAQTNMGRFIETVVGPWARSAQAEAQFRTAAITNPVVAAAATALTFNQAQDADTTAVPSREEALALVNQVMPDHQRLGAMAFTLQAELEADGVILAAPQIVAQLEDAISADEFDRIKEEEADRLIEEARNAGVDPGNLVTRGFDATVEAVFGAAEWFEAITQQIGVQALDFSGDVGEAFLAASSGQVDDAWSALQNTVELSKEETVGDFFGLEGSAREWTNLASSLVFDPTNLLFAGGATRRLMMEALTTNPALAPLAMRTRGMRGVIDGLTAGAAGRSPGTLADDLRSALDLTGISAIESGREVAQRALREAVDSGIVTRFQEHGATFGTTPSQRPGGLFVSVGSGRHGSIPEGEAGALTHHRLNPRSTIREFTDERLDVPLEARGGISHVSAPIHALLEIRGRSFVDELLGTPTGDLIELLAAEYGVDTTRLVGRSRDAYELVEIIGAQEARRSGWDAVRVLDESFPDLSEVLVLTDSALNDAADRALRQLFAIDNLSPEAHLRILDLVDSGAGREAFEEVFMSELPSAGGTFIPASMGHATRRNTALGMSELARNFGALSDESAEKVARTLMMLSDDSTVALRGPRGFDAVKRAILSIFPDDMDQAARILRSYVDQTGGGIRTVENLNAVRTQHVQRLGELLDNEIPGALGNRSQGYDLPGVKAQIATLEQQIDGATTEAVEAVLAPELERLRGVLTDLEDRTGNLTELRAEVRRLEAEIERVDARLAEPFSETDTIVFWHRFYDEVADDLGLEKLPDANPYVPDLQQRDWSTVTGRDPDTARTLAYRWHEEDRARSLVAGPQGSLTAEETAALAETADALQFGAQRSYMTLPANPWEIAMYRNLKDNPRALRRWQELQRGERTRHAHNIIRSVFNTNLLINAATPLKTRLDESVRLLYETGNIEDFLRSTFSFFGGSEGALSSEAAQFGREVGGISTTQYGWQIWDNPVFAEGGRAPSNWVPSVERFLNGSLANDDLAQMWARVQRELATPDELRAWWDSPAGLAQYDGRTVALEVGEDGAGRINISSTEGGADEVIRAFDQQINTWLDRVVAPELKEELRERIVEVLTSGNQFAANNARDARLMRQLRFIPAAAADIASSNRTPGVVGPLWNLLYGNPGRRSGGVFFDNYMNFAVDLYTKAAENNGRLLTAQMLADRFGIGIEDATSLIKRGARDPRMRDVFAQGFVTEAQIRVQAAEYARARADDLMYGLVSRSIAGTKADQPLLLPFFRAQTDFLSYWSRQFTDGPVTRMSRERLAQMADGNVFSRTAGAAIERFERLPINVRMMARWSHMAAAANDEDQPFGSPSWFLNRFTFFPLRNGPGFLMNVIPQPGLGATVPWWAADRYTDEPGWMETVERFLPSLEFAFGDVGAEVDPADGINMLIPSSDRTLRGLFGNAFNAIPGLNATPFAEQAAAALLEQSEPPGITSDMRRRGAEWLNQNHTEFVPGTPEWNEAIAEMGEESRLALRQEDGLRGLRSQVPGLGDFSFGADHLESMLILVTPTADGGFLDILETNGKLLPEDQVDLFGEDGEAGLIEKFRTGVATEDELTSLLDLMSTMLFDRAADIDFIPERDRVLADGTVSGKIEAVSLIDVMLVNHPGLAVNMVSTQTCMPQSGGGFFDDNFCSADGRLINVPQGEEGRDLRSEWRRNGWIGYRTEGGPDGWMLDAALRVETARGRVARGLYAWLSGRPFGDSPTNTFLRSSFDFGALPDQVTDLADTIGLRLPSGVVTGEEARTVWSSFLDGVAGGDITRGFTEGPLSTTLARSATTVDGEPALWSGSEWSRLMDETRDYLRTNGLSLFDMPEDIRAWFRDNVFTPAIDAGDLGTELYAREAQRIFGPLDYQIPDPPALGSDRIEFQRTLTADAISVLDGDTIRTDTADGFVDFRLIGINTPEHGQPGYTEATAALEEFLAGAERVDLVMFDPERYGRVQTFDGRERVKVWLYVDGVPIWEPSWFTSQDPTGAAFGGTVPDFAGILRDNSPTPATTGPAT